MIDAETRRQWNKQCKYEDRFIALLDIMGFSELVYDEDYNSTFVGILGATATASKQNNAKGTCFERVKTAIISDTIVISAEKSSPTALEDILYAIRSVFQAFLREGVIIRGAICCGKLFHQNNIVFGPAMVEAHRLEQSIAIYPRIILSSNTQFDFFCGDQRSVGAFIQDSDGIPYFDLYREVIVHSYERADDQEPLMIRQLIDKHLSDPKSNERVRQKYLWIREHFNLSLEEQLHAKRINRETYDKWLIK